MDKLNYLSFSISTLILLSLALLFLTDVLKTRTERKFSRIEMADPAAQIKYNGIVLRYILLKSILIAFFTVFTGLIHWNYFNLAKPFDLSHTPDIQSQIEKLTDIKKSIPMVIGYFESQKKVINENKREIEAKNNEIERLTKLIGLSKRQVDSLFAEMDTRQRKKAWLHWLLTFLIGILSGISAFYITKLITNKTIESYTRK